MSPTLYAALIFILFFAIIYFMYGKMVAMIVKYSKPLKKMKNGKTKRAPLTAGEVAQCYIPIYQVVYLRKVLYKSVGAWGGIAIASVVLILLRFLNMLVPINSYVMFATIICIYLGILLHVILYGGVTAAVFKMYGCNWGVIILSFFIPHFIAPFMMGNIATRMQSLQKEEVFSEHHEDTYIQSRTHK